MPSNCPHCGRGLTGEVAVCPHCHRSLGARPGPAAGALTLTDTERAFLVELRAQTDHLQSIEHKVSFFYWIVVAEGILMLIAIIAGWLMLR